MIAKKIEDGIVKLIVENQKFKVNHVMNMESKRYKKVITRFDLECEESLLKQVSKVVAFAESTFSLNVKEGSTVLIDGICGFKPNTNEIEIAITNIEIL